MRQHLTVIVLACGLAVSAIAANVQRASAVEVGVESNSAAPGDSVNMCVYMSGSQNQVVGIQMQLRWDGDCVSVIPTGDRAALCTGFVAGKLLSTAIGTSPCDGDPNCLIGLLVSLTDTVPMDDQELFCCSFIVATQPPRTTCPFTLTGVIASDPTGKRVLGVHTVDGSLTIALPRVNTASASQSTSNGSGCAVGPPDRSRSGAWLLLFGFAAWLATIWRRRHRPR